MGRNNKYKYRSRMMSFQRFVLWETLLRPLLTDGFADIHKPSLLLCWIFIKTVIKKRTDCNVFFFISCSLLLQSTPYRKSHFLRNGTSFVFLPLWKQYRIPEFTGRFPGVFLENPDETMHIDISYLIGYVVDFHVLRKQFLCFGDPDLYQIVHKIRFDRFLEYFA